MKYTQGEYRLIRKDNLGRDLYRFVLECPEIAAVAAPGQFVHILPKGSTLRRPISICQIDRQAGTLTLVFAVRGEGTAVLADLRAGDYVDMLAPLGHGFTIQPDANRVILMGGGIGVPPMLALAEIYGKRATVISGFRSMPAVMLQEEFAKSGAKTILCTDDGTAGLHAMVTEPLLEEIRQEKPDMICACGPTPMLRAIARIAEEQGIFCEVSMEERMGCGIGACLVCACKMKLANGEIHAAHVCKDGPVFNAKEVAWNG